MWSSRRGARILALGVGVALLFVEWLATAYTFDRSVDAVEVVLDEAVPSIAHLAETQGVLAELAQDMRNFGGLAGRAPALTGATAVAAFASLGLPGLAGFVAELQIFVGAFALYPWLAAIGLLGLLITAALFLQVLQRTFLGELPERWAGWRDLTGVELASLGTLLVLVVAIGVAPAPLLAVIDAGVRPLVGR